MGESKEEKEMLEKLIPKVMPDIIKKEVKVQYEGKQLSIRLPALLVNELKIKKGDVFIIEYNGKTKEYSFKLKKGLKKNGKKV